MNPVQGATIADDARIEGTFAGRDLTVLGRFEGELTLTGTLRVGRDAHLVGHVRAEVVEVDGTFEGTLHATRLAFGEKANARGTFAAPQLSMREGARVEGAINVDPAPASVVASTEQGQGPRSAPRSKPARKSASQPAPVMVDAGDIDPEDLEALERATRPDTPAAAVAAEAAQGSALQA